MTDPFESPKSLVQRGIHHIDDFQSSALRIVRTGPYEEFSDLDETTGETRHKVRVNADYPPADVVCIAFDAINCLRSALDHVVFSAVAVLTNTSDPEDTKFPFGDSYTEAEGEFKRGARGVPASLWDFLLAFEPYKGGDKTLWGFNKIRNGNIHRVIVPTAHAVVDNMIFFGNGIIGSARSVSEWDAAKRELTHYRTREVFADIEYNFAIDIAFSETSEFPRMPVVQTLRAIAGKVDSIVLGLERETARLVARSPR